MTTSVTPAVLQAGAQLTTTAAVYITGPAAAQVIIKRVVVTNVTGGAVAVGIWRVPSGSSPGTTNAIIPGRSIAANGTDLVPELVNMVLNPGDTIQADASAATSLNIFASGYIAS